MEKVVQKAKNELFKKITAYNSSINIDKIERAFKFAYDAHKPQIRASGEPYILHPLAVADILADLRLDAASIITALLHDTVEDTHILLGAITQQFGEEIAHLVDGVTKLAKIEYQPEHIKQAENFRKLLVAISEDLRVLLVKLADRLHNMRTLHYIQDKDKRQLKAHETMEIYAPLAERIGIHKFKNELQDLAFEELYPKIRESILERLTFLHSSKTHIVETINKKLLQTLKNAGMQAVVEGREKTPCSIWHKMDRKDLGFEQLSDIVAFRVLVDDVADCYRALGVIHQKYHVISSHFKDYISTPKNNGYKSLHTVVLGPQKRCIEIQIRTHEMHEFAELGLAAHWSYKSGLYQHQGTQFKWVRELLNILKNASTPEEFMEDTRLEMYYDQVFCFTPKGDLIALPKGATIVDFAFAVHTNIGLSCKDAKVNGRIMPLKTALENGDQVEIIRSKEFNPLPIWNEFVITGKAKMEVRKFIRSQQRDEYLNVGRMILSKTFEQNDIIYNENNLSLLLDKYKHKTVCDLIVAIGNGEINRLDILNFFKSNGKYTAFNKNFISFSALKSINKEFFESQKFIKNLPPQIFVNIAQCCNPVFNDKIIGELKDDIIVHKFDCSIDNQFDRSKDYVDIDWEMINNKQFVSKIKLILINDIDSIAIVTNALVKLNISIDDIIVTNKSIDFYDLFVDINIMDSKQLDETLNTLRVLKCVNEVSKVTKDEL